MKWRVWFATVVAATVAAASTPASAAVLANYDFTGASAESSDTDANSTASIFSDGDLTLDIVGFGSPNSSVFKSYTSLPNAVSSGSGTSYFEFNVAAKSGYRLNLTDLSFAGQRNMITGAAASNAHVQLDVRSSVDAYASNLATFKLTGNSGAFVSPAFSTLLDAPFQNLRSVTFRIYANDFGRAHATRGLRIDNVVLNGGSVALPKRSAVPEPASMAVWGVLGGVFAGRAWRRRRLATAS